MITADRLTASLAELTRASVTYIVEDDYRTAYILGAMHFARITALSAPEHHPDATHTALTLMACTVEWALAIAQLVIAALELYQRLNLR